MVYRLLILLLLVCSAAVVVANLTKAPFSTTSTYTYNKEQSETVCKDETLQLSCDKGRRLLISSVRYGFDDMIPQACTSPHFLLSNKNTECFSTNAAIEVGNLCHNKRACNIKANAENFGSFCPNIGKYLKVTYSCVPKGLVKPDTAVKVSPLKDSMLEDAGCNCTQVVQADHKHTPSDSTLVFGWVHSVSYIRANQEKIILYGMLCGCLAFICALVAFIARMFYVRYRKVHQLAGQQKLNVTETNVQDTSNEENTYIAAADPSDMMQYNLGYRSEVTNRLNSGPNSYRGSSANRVYNNSLETPRFNTNSLTVTNPLHGSENRRNFNHSPLTTTSTAMNNSPNTAVSENRNTYYENSADDEHTNDDNDPMLCKSHSIIYNQPDSGPDVRPRTNSLFDRHS